MTKRHHILAVKVSFTVKKPTYFHCLAQFPPVCRIRAYSAGSLLEQRPQSNKSAATPRLNTFRIFRGASPPPPLSNRELSLPGFTTRRISSKATGLTCPTVRVPTQIKPSYWLAGISAMGSALSAAQKNFLYTFNFFASSNIFCEISRASILV